jgi:hypothetical protein
VAAKRIRRDTERPPRECRCAKQCSGTASRARVTTCGKFDQALQAAGKSGSGVYIEVVTDAYAASPLAMKLHDAVKTLYAS